MIPVSRLLAQGRKAESVVARRWDERLRRVELLTWEDLHADVARLRARLLREPAGPWVLLAEDGYAFAVGLLGLWHAGRHAILPPNRQSRTLHLLQTRAVGTLSDRAEWFDSALPVHPLQVEEGTAAPEVARVLPREALSVELFTSGTTGGEKPVVKRVAHLEDEVEQLEACFGEALGDATFFSTAAPQHLYGLLFGVLWPLCAGRPFQTERFLHASELVPRMLDAGTSVLASVPTVLRRLARHGGMAALRGHCRAVFSSGGPLAADTAHALAGTLGEPPIEVFGSTETGGIAWRRQRPGEARPLWEPFPVVEVRRDESTGLLRVRSPLVSIDADGGGVATGDRIDLRPDGRFELGGRADRVVKVGEKRLDLDSMASALRAHEWVDDVALATIERDADLRVAAVVVGSEEGLEALRREGRRAFQQGLLEALADSWDPVLHPRYWRIVSELPTNAQGKLPRESIERLFASGAQGPGAQDRPEVLEELRGSDFIERTCRVPDDLQCFAGHFPGSPLVPGVLQLDWAMDLAGLLLGATPAIERIEALKFLAPLLPGMQFQIHVRLASRPGESSGPGDGDERPWLELTLFSATDRHAYGRLLLAASVASHETRSP